MHPLSAEAQRGLDATGSSPLVEVDRSRCGALAARIRALPVPDDREGTPLAGVASEHVDDFYLSLVAICHQTSPRGLPPLVGDVDGQHLRGWDYLAARWAEVVRRRPNLLTPRGWRDVDEKLVRAAFADAKHGERLTDPAGRAALIRDLGSVMMRERWESFRDVYDEGGGRVLVGNPNLFGLLERFAAYQDPVRKKSNFLLEIMRNSAGWRYQDEENLGPPVDYHEVRGHLRIGTVIVRDGALLEKLRGGVPVSASDDVALRRATYDAVILVSELSEIRDASRLHYLFWNIFRSDCTREAPHCHACPPSCPLPTRYVFANPDGRRHCPFATVCSSACAPTKLQEHVLVTELY